MHSMSSPPVAVRMAALAQSPSVLLVATGTLIGLNFPLGKLGGQAGVAPAMWALIISFGASTALLPATRPADRSAASATSTPTPSAT